MDAPSTPEVPSSKELYNLFNSFITRWANLPTEYIPTAMEDLSALPTEQAIYFSQPIEGLLILRTSGRFEKYLAELAEGKKSGRGSHDKGMFMEMCVLFWHLLIMYKWKADTRLLPPAVIKSSTPWEWPDRKPDCFCSTFVKKHPVEIRLWAAASPTEMESWKKIKK
jgi:hypothetical protein